MTPAELATADLRRRAWKILVRMRWENPDVTATTVDTCLTLRDGRKLVRVHSLCRRNGAGHVSQASRPAITCALVIHSTVHRLGKVPHRPRRSCPQTRDDSPCRLAKVAITVQ